MIDFSSKKFLKLRQDSSYVSKIEPFLVHNEMILDSYKSARDGVVFTDRRIINVNVMGLSGRKVDFTSISYKKIGLFSIESDGTFELDADLTVRVSGIHSPIKFEFKGKTKIIEIAQHIGQAL